MTMFRHDHTLIKARSWHGGHVFRPGEYGKNRLVSDINWARVLKVRRMEADKYYKMQTKEIDKQTNGRMSIFFESATVGELPTSEWSQ